MEMSYNITADMTSFASIQLGDVGMDVGTARNEDQQNAAHPRSPASSDIPKKKRRTNVKGSRAASKKLPTVQDLAPPLLTGYGDNIVITNPFDDSPPKTSQCMMMDPTILLPYPMEALTTIRDTNSMIIRGTGPMMRSTSPMMRGTDPMMRCTGPMMGGTVPMMRSTGPMMRGTDPMMGGTNPMRMRCMNPMMPMMNVMRTPMSHNTGNIRHKIYNHVNNMSGCAIVNQAPTSFTNPMNITAQSLSNVPMIVKKSTKMGEMINHQITYVENSMNNTRFNNPAIDRSMGMNIANNWVRPNGPANVPLRVNNANNLQGQNVSLQNRVAQLPSNMGNNAGNIELLKNMNMNVSQQNQIGLSSGSMSQAPNNKSGIPPMGHPTSQNIAVQHPNLQRGLDMGPKTNSSEKIYPADMPMIMNYQNPNAPDLYSCGICHKVVGENDQAITCESGCNLWFHRLCVGLSDAAFELLTQEQYAEWICDNCISSTNIPMVKFEP